MERRFYLRDFQPLKLSYRTSQEDTLAWLAEANHRAALHRRESSTSEAYKKLLKRVGCFSNQIGYRHHELEDFTHQEFSRMKVYKIDQDTVSYGMDHRMGFYGQTVDAAFQRLYQDVRQPPSHLIHVTCTGYISPSGAQKLVASRGWGKETTITHTYHMGCYGAFPAIYLALGNLAYSQLPSRVDIVHTELCSLHLDLKRPSIEQLTIQSLFSDGIIRYSVYRNEGNSGFEGRKGGSFEILSWGEELIPGTEDAMTWKISDWGMKMTLSKDVPRLIQGHVKEFVNQLGKKAEIDIQLNHSKIYYAIHPGGPKILDYVENLLELKPVQLYHSRSILFEYGNMSSATLPHIWERMLKDPLIQKDDLVLSIAFGPGLTIVGGLLRKVV